MKNSLHHGKLNTLLKIIGFIILLYVTFQASFALEYYMKRIMGNFTGLSTMVSAAVLIVDALIARKIVGLSWKIISITIIVCAIIFLLPSVATLLILFSLWGK